MTTSRKKLSNPLNLILALVAGLGLILMVIALGMGVVLADADGTLIGGLFALGLMLLIFGVGAWIVATQPFKNFDDINVPMDIAHHDEGHVDHEIAVTEQAHIVEPDAPHHS